MDDKMRNDLRDINRENYIELWKKAKADDYDDVTNEEKRLMKILLDHEEEFSEIFENADILAGYEFDPETEQNPFMHITMHSIVENQLENRDPIEVYQFYLAMLKKKCSRHEVIHLISAIFVHLLYRVLKNNEPFDIERYKLLLKKYKNRKPHKVWALLEEPESPE
jgi:hypothetical protein